MKRLVLLVVLLPALSACVPPPARVETPQTAAMDKSYTVDLPVGWIRQFTETGELLASRDGFLLQTILVEKRPLKTAFPKTKKEATATLLPSELAERAIAELKTTSEQLGALTVLENEPVLVSGREGFRLRVAYRNERGVEIWREVVGVTDDKRYYQLTYFAPKLYYFDKYHAEFAGTVESFKLAGSAQG
jgi:hypothetical protein